MSKIPALGTGCLNPLVLLETRKCRGQKGGYIGLSPCRGTCWEPYWLKTRMSAVVIYVWAHSCKYVQYSHPVLH